MLDWGFLCLFGTYCYSVLLLLHLTFFSVTVWVQMHLFQNIKYVPNVRVVPVSLSRDIIKTWSFSFDDGPEPTFVKMIQEQHRHADMRLCFTLQIHSADTQSLQYKISTSLKTALYQYVSNVGVLFTYRLRPVKWSLHIFLCNVPGLSMCSHVYMWNRHAR